jgi:FlaA1/EpsC-like NDP-sugar epimerase
MNHLGKKLDGKVMLVTGANGGIARELCSQIAQKSNLKALVIHCRTKKNATALCSELR